MARQDQANDQFSLTSFLYGGNADYIDALYAEHAEATAKALKQAGARLVLMAGRPGDREAALKSAGVDQFLFAGADAVATLKGLQDKLGVS